MFKAGSGRSGSRGGSLTTDSKPSWDQLRGEAADWLAGLDTGTADVGAFEAWRDADPRHAVAFAQAAHALKRLDRVKPSLRDRVPAVRVTSRRALLFSGGLVVTGVGALAAAVVATAKTTVRTAVGQRTLLRFEPGGTMQVNTDSKVQWRRDDQIIDVWLKKGEVALDFTGQSGWCRVNAAGRTAKFSNSRINARLRGGLLDLAVVDGSCTLAPYIGTDGNSGETVVSAKHAAVVNAGHSIVRALGDADTAYISGWTKGELVFQGQSLETAVGEYNRYLTRKIFIVDPELAALRLGGRYTSRDPKAFLQGLHDSFGIKIVQGESGIGLTK